MATVSATKTQSHKKPKGNNPVPFGNTITTDDLKRHLYIIAGAEMEGRETATNGQRKAAAYIENQFRVIGLAPGNKENYQMQYPVQQEGLYRFQEQSINQISLFKTYSICHKSK